MINSLRFILNHPLNAQHRLKTLFRLMAWQLNIRINPFPIVYSFTKNSKLIISKGETASTGNLYCGLYEFEDMCFLLHLLRKDDLFIDIGANIGSYTVLASGEIGAKTISIEPIPSTFHKLMQNIKINNIENIVKPLNIGLGSAKSVLKFTTSYDTVNHVARSGDTDTVDVPVDTLDSICTQEIPTLIKMDVEGFETEVVNGANSTFRNPSLKALIIELNDYSLQYGYKTEDVHQKLLGYGFFPVQYNPFQKSLTRLKTYTNLNTIYIRDEDFVIERLTQAPKIEVSGIKI